MRMCNDGECLDSVDWKCGMELEYFAHSDQLSDYFYAIARKGKPWTSLDAAGKYCGKRFSTFVGHYGRPKEFKEAGGEWGKTKLAPRIDY